MNDWVISIGTGKAQVPLISAAKSAGYRVLGVDRSPNLALVDDALGISTFDALQITSALTQYSGYRPFKAVLARTSGPAVQSATMAADFLGLPSFGVEFSRASVSKAALRKAAVMAGVPRMEGQCVSSTPAWVDGSDWVIKPDQPLFGKRNVYRVNNEASMRRAFAAAAEESVNGFVECQPYIQGRDLGLVLALSKGRVEWYFLYEELVLEQRGRFKGRGVVGPAQLVEPKTYSDMREAAERLAMQWGTSGFAFFSFRLPSCGPALLYEANPGLCGDGLADILFPALWSGMNFFELDIILMTGGKFSPPPPPRTYAALLDGQLLTDDSAKEMAK